MADSEKTTKKILYIVNVLNNTHWAAILVEREIKKLTIFDSLQLPKRYTEEI